MSAAHRPAGSHVRDDGVAKRSYETYDDAANEADRLWQREGRPRNAYRCDQKPEHYHVGHGAPDIRTRP